MNLNEIAQAALRNSIQREKNGANISVENILKHCAGEVIEAQEAKLLYKIDAHNINEYAEELADVILCALIAAAAENIDIEKAINNKLQKNAQRAALQGDKL